MLTTGEKLDLIHTFVSCVAIRGETSIGSVLLVFDSATINWENKMPQTWENSLPHSGKNKCHFSGKVLAVYTHAYYSIKPPTYSLYRILLPDKEEDI